MPRKTHWLFVALIVVIGFITATGILCWQGSIIMRGQDEARQQASNIQRQIQKTHQGKIVQSNAPVAPTQTERINEDYLNALRTADLFLTSSLQPCDAEKAY